jgi:hypothetical protein
LKKPHTVGGKIYSEPRKRKDEIKKARRKTEGGSRGWGKRY